MFVTLPTRDAFASRFFKRSNLFSLKEPSWWLDTALN
jgi:hypothetical protein